MAPLVLLGFARPTPKHVLMGIPLILAGEAIRLWAAGYLNKLGELVTAGPFALCRNPLYIGSFLTSLGYLVMCDRPVLWAPAIALFWLFHGGAVAYEEKLLRERFGPAYDAYCRAVPRFVPIPRGLSGNGRFTLRQLVLNNEHHSVAGALLLVGLMLLKARTPCILPVGWLVTLMP